MTDLRITLPDGTRHEVSNTFLTPHSTEAESLKDVLFNRSPAPSKKEVRVESGRAGRKAHNNKRVMQRAYHPPKPPINQQTPRPAGGLPHEVTHNLPVEATSPFEHTPTHDLYKRWW